MYFKGQLLKDTHEFPKTLIDSLQNGQVIPFVGAGVSRAIQNKDTGKPLFPNWKELPLKASLSLILGTEAHCISSGLPPGALASFGSRIADSVNHGQCVVDGTGRKSSFSLTKNESPSRKSIPFQC